jgi:hypothetical protein
MAMAIEPHTTFPLKVSLKSTGHANSATNGLVQSMIENEEEAALSVLVMD